MKRRRNHFLIGLLSAAITFGTLTAFAGRMNWHRHGWGYHHHCCIDRGMRGSEGNAIRP